MTPSTGPANTGTAVQIQGTGFDSTTLVYFGATKVIPSSVPSSTTLDLVTPSLPSGSVVVSLARGDGAKAQLPVDFTFTSPVGPLAALTISSMTPSSGPANTATSVQIQGTGFDSTTVAYFGTAMATPSSVTATSLNVSTPLEPAGNVAVSLVRGDGSKAQAPTNFTFTGTGGSTVGLVASSMSPDTGTVNGNVPVTIQGAGFDSTVVVYFGSTKVTPSSISSNSLVVNTPPAKVGDVAVYVDRGDGSSAQVPGDFAYTDPLSITSTQLPNATVGTSYTAALTAVNGVPPYTWTTVQGALPSGTTLQQSGTISGTPVTTGTSQFTVQVVDQAGGQVSAPESLDVVASSGQVDTTSCQALTANNTTYVLQNDVSSTGTCFEIENDNITLDLNGHTITYGTGGGTDPTPAITVCDSWDPGLPSSECGGDSHNAPTVYNGSIVQSSNAAPFSHVFAIGEGTNIGNGYIHDITATFSATGTQFINGNYPGPGWRIQHNTINDNVTNIQHPGQEPLSARSQLQGYAIHLDNGDTPTGAADDISGNTINGSPQGGISDGQNGSQIYNNTINLTSTYSNDYGVISMVNGQNIHDNTVTGAGRGLDGEGSGFIFNHNTINVAENGKNTEYGGCELDGTYGIRVKNYNYTPGSTSTNFQITNNTVTTPATVCDANALDLTDMSPTVTGTISGNTFSVPSGAGFSAALGFEADDAAQITFNNNSFTSDTCVLIGGNGDINYGAFTVQSGQTWGCAKGPTVQAEDLTLGQGTPSPQLTIQDTIPDPTVGCWAYSTAIVTIGSYTHQCN
ncbi:MAG: IPT/TIG domain-containing protein [Acidobacteriaceae bacterium]